MHLLSTKVALLSQFLITVLLKNKHHILLAKTKKVALASAFFSYQSLNAGNIH